MTPASTTPSTLPRTRGDFRQALEKFSRELGAGFWCAQAGTVAKFYAGPPQTADVTLNESIIVGYQTNAAGAVKPITRPYPTFPAVPVIFLQGGGGAITFPIQTGDTCLLLFLDRDLDAWLTSGQTGLPPQTNRLHSPSDAVAIVGLNSYANGLPPVALDGIEINHPSVTVNGNLHVNSGANGSFMSADGQLVTVIDGIVVNIV